MFKNGLKMMNFLARLIYKLFGVYTIIHIMNTNNEILRSNVKIKFIPQSNDLIYFEDDGDYFLVMKVIHLIKNRHEIWVVTQKFIG